MIVVLMGVSGCGKTTVGQALAAELHWPLIEGDELHPQANIAKMASGVPLTDADRWPWYDRLVGELERHGAAGKDVVLACSALKQAYRDRLAQGGDVRFVYLKGDARTIEPRLVIRKGHYMPPALLGSQFATLEEPSDAIVVDIAQPVAAQVAAIRGALDLPLPA